MVKAYFKIFVSGKLYLAHRLAWYYMKGLMPKRQIDHIDHNMANNIFSNLRDVTALANRTNQPMRCNNKSGHTGVNWCKQSNKWHAQISGQGKKISLGKYDLLSEAVKVRKEAEAKYGYHKNHGGKS